MEKGFAMNFRKSCRAAAVALLAGLANAVCAQDAPPQNLLLTRAGWEIGAQVSDYEYKEPAFAVPRPFPGMNLEGTRIGVVGAYTGVGAKGIYGRIDGRVSYGKLDYFSPPTGPVDDIPDWTAEVRAVVGKDYVVREGIALSPYIGLGYRWLYNDLRGYTTVGSVTYAGYERYSQYWYAPIGLTARIRMGSEWVFAPTVEYDAFIGGKQKSYLSQVSPTYLDITNRQDRGFGYRVSLMFEGRRWSFGPWLHYWRIKDSDFVFAGFDPNTGDPVGGLEPDNSTTEYGLELRYRF